MSHVSRDLPEERRASSDAVPLVSSLFRGLWRGNNPTKSIPLTSRTKSHPVEPDQKENISQQTQTTAASKVNSTFQIPSGNWLLTTFGSLENLLVSAAQTRSNEDLENVVKECKEYFGDLEESEFLIKAVRRCRGNEIREVTRRATFIYNTASNEANQAQVKDKRVALLTIQAYAARCLIECAVIHIAGEEVSTASTQGSKFFVRAFGASMQTASSFAQDNQSTLARIVIEACIKAMERVHEIYPVRAENSALSTYVLEAVATLACALQKQYSTEYVYT